MVKINIDWLKLLLLCLDVLILYFVPINHKMLTNIIFATVLKMLTSIGVALTTSIQFHKWEWHTYTQINRCWLQHCYYSRFILYHITGSVPGVDVYAETRRKENESDVGMWLQL